MQVHRVILIHGDLSSPLSAIWRFALIICWFVTTVTLQSDSIMDNRDTLDNEVRKQQSSDPPVRRRWRQGPDVTASTYVPCLCQCLKRSVESPHTSVLSIMDDIIIVKKTEWLHIASTLVASLFANMKPSQQKSKPHTLLTIWHLYQLGKKQYLNKE